VLLTTVLTLTIIALLCATSLYVTSQNTNSTMQASSWQLSLTGSETGIDLAIRALNTNVWTGWTTVSLANASSLPVVEPTPFAGASPVPTAPPDNSHYLYLPSNSTYSNLTVSNTEGATSVSSWVTIDTAGMDPLQDANGQQWYRVRATGQAAVSGPARASGNRLDNSLRNTIGLVFNRKGGTFKGPTRTVEVILQPLASGGWVRGITLNSKFIISGSGIIDSFNSSNSLYSNNGVYDVTKHLAHGDVGTAHSSGSGISGGAHLYGALAFSGPAVAGANNTTVSGNISSPFNPTFPATYDPVVKPGNSGYTWTNTLPVVNDNWSGGGVATNLTGGNSLPKDSSNNVITSVTATSTDPTAPTLVIISSGFTVAGGQSFTVNSANNDPNNPNYMVIWVKGKYTTSGSGIVNQAANTKVTWIVDNDITTSGNSYSNAGTNHAGNTLFVQPSGTQNADGTWPLAHKITISGTADWIGQISAPSASVVISGGGSVVGALIADNANISGGSGFHYDEALKGGSSLALGNYAFASWFEDNSAPKRGIYY